jgi:tetratricopeptide (TPR) repeat protein
MKQEQDKFSSKIPLIRSLLLAFTLCYCSLQASLLWAGPKKPLSYQQVNNYLELINQFKAKQPQEILTRFKYALANGNTQKAQAYLNKLQNNRFISEDTLHYWKAIMSFIKEDYSNSLSLLKRIGAKSVLNYSKLCYFTNLNHLFLRQRQALLDDWGRCYSSLFSQSPNGLFWPDTLINVFVYDTPYPVDIYFLNRTNDPTRIATWLKAHLFLGNHRPILARIDKFPDNLLADESIKNILGMHYFQNQEYVKSFEFLKEIDGPNAQLIKGNLYLGSKNYPKALEAFKQVLKKRPNSKEAVTRIIALAWLMENYPLGLEFLQRYYALDNSQDIGFFLLGSLFFAANKNYDLSFETIHYFLKKLNFAMNPIILTHLRFITLKTKRLAESRQYSYEACKNHDPLACWQLLKLETDTNILQPAPFSSKDWDQFYTDIVQAPSESVLKQKTYFDQNDIYSLDQQPD